MGSKVASSRDSTHFEDLFLKIERLACCAFDATSTIRNRVANSPCSSPIHSVTSSNDKNLYAFPRIAGRCTVVLSYLMFISSGFFFVVEVGAVGAVVEVGATGAAVSEVASRFAFLSRFFCEGGAGVDGCREAIVDDDVVGAGVSTGEEEVLAVATTCTEGPVLAAGGCGVGGSRGLVSSTIGSLGSVPAPAVEASFRPIIQALAPTTNARTRTMAAPMRVPLLLSRDNGVFSSEEVDVTATSVVEPACIAPLGLPSNIVLDSAMISHRLMLSNARRAPADSTKGCSVLASSVTEENRFSGSFSRHRNTAASSSAGMSGRRVERSGGGSNSTCDNTS